MKKSDLITKISEDSSLTKAQTEKFLNSFIHAVTEELANKGKISLIGFGTFKTVERKATTGRNPSNGEPIQIEARAVPKFLPGKALKDSVKEGKVIN